MFKLALNAGHGLNTAGKRCMKKLDPNQTREWVLNSRICEKIETKLKAYTGYNLIRLDDPTGKKDVALKTRTNNANNFGADFYLSIHHNAGVKGGSGGGIVAYIYTKPSKKSEEWQDALYDAIIKHTGLKGNRSDGTLKANFHECRESNMPCVLLECGFMDSKTDVPIILTDKFAEQVAEACVEVIVKKAGLKKKATKTETPKKENKILEWQKAAIKDGFKFEKYGADGKWGGECEEVAKKAVCKKRLTYKYKNLTKIIQYAVGVDVDGKFGAGTKKAVTQYQKLLGLNPDGAVGLDTWKKILGVK
ncbi:MAG: N-acetylmuramoyl-L-alanine amidase [Clostridia bacterium]|nr:N-acetylmuramoyl-L-alanine amidase [Clostridia bacterium]